MSPISGSVQPAGTRPPGTYRPASPAVSSAESLSGHIARSTVHRGTSQRPKPSRTIDKLQMPAPRSRADCHAVRQVDIPPHTTTTQPDLGESALHAKPEQLGRAIGLRSGLGGRDGTPVSQPLSCAASIRLPERRCSSALLICAPQPYLRYLYPTGLQNMGKRDPAPPSPDPTIRISPALPEHVSRLPSSQQQPQRVLARNSHLWRTEHLSLPAVDVFPGVEYLAGQALPLTLPVGRRRRARKQTRASILRREAPVTATSGNLPTALTGWGLRTSTTGASFGVVPSAGMCSRHELTRRWGSRDFSTRLLARGYEDAHVCPDGAPGRARAIAETRRGRLLPGTAWKGGGDAQADRSDREPGRTIQIRRRDLPPPPPPQSLEIPSHRIIPHLSSSRSPPLFPVPRAAAEASQHAVFPSETPRPDRPTASRFSSLRRGHPHVPGESLSHDPSTCRGLWTDCPPPPLTAAAGSNKHGRRVSPHDDA
ncbi:unnamed protein product [Diplocarpon coronariae]